MNRLAELAGGAIPPDADRTTIANIVTSVAAVKVQTSHERVQASAAMFQPFFSDLNIHHQRHRFIDAPLILQARDGIATANNLLNMARFRLSAIRAEIGHGPALDLDHVLMLCLGVHAMVDRAEAKNRQVLDLFHRVDGPSSRTMFRNISNTFNRSE